MFWDTAPGWPANFIPEEYPQVQPFEVETLLVSGSIDFNTPAQFATDDLLPSLSKGKHVILSEFGQGEMLRLQSEASSRPPTPPLSLVLEKIRRMEDMRRNRKRQ